MKHFIVTIVEIHMLIVDVSVYLSQAGQNVLMHYMITIFTDIWNTHTFKAYTQDEIRKSHMSKMIMASSQQPKHLINFLLTFSCHDKCVL